MVLVYCVTLAYGRFRKRPANTLLNLLGTLLATASAVVSIRWGTPLIIHAPHGTFWYYLGVASLAAAGPGTCGMLLMVFGLEFHKYDPDDIGWFHQLALPFYMSFLLYGGLMVLGGLLGLLLPSSLLPNR